MSDFLQGGGPERGRVEKVAEIASQWESAGPGAGKQNYPGSLV